MNHTDREEQRNVTVTLPTELLKEVRHLAVDKGVSLSRFISLLLEQEVAGQRRYQAAKERQLTLLRTGLPLGTNGRIPWTRSDLHER